MIKIFEHNGEKEYHVVGQDDYEGFRPIVEYFINVEQAKPVKLTQGPANRYAQLQVQNCLINVTYESGLGTYFTFTPEKRNERGIKRVVKELSESLQNGQHTSMSLQPGTTKNVNGKRYVLNENHRWTLPDPISAERKPSPGQLDLFDFEDDASKRQTVYDLLEKAKAAKAAEKPDPYEFDFTVNLSDRTADYERLAGYRKKIRELPEKEQKAAKTAYYSQGLDHLLAQKKVTKSAYHELTMINAEKDIQCTIIKIPNAPRLKNHPHRTNAELQKRLLEAVEEVDKYKGTSIREVNFINNLKQFTKSPGAMGVCNQRQSINIGVDTIFEYEARYRLRESDDFGDGDDKEDLNWLVDQTGNLMQNVMVHEIGHAAHFAEFDRQRHKTGDFMRGLEIWWDTNRTWKTFYKDKNKAWLKEFAKEFNLMEPEAAEKSNVSNLRHKCEWGIRNLLVKEVSEYASTCPVELVAETFLKLHKGEKVHPTVMYLFRHFKGQDPELVENVRS